ncbi:MAG: Gfo/Idh/MocA family protein [Planctomycetaceae bacterium]
MSPSRREFIRVAGATGVALASSPGRAAAADDVVVALIGCGGQGRSVARACKELPGVRLAYLCDPDEERRSVARSELGVGEPVADLRRVLDDTQVDAVIVATPDHWHAPASILACDAGKHVYVEKPCSHNLREARLLLDAARRNRVVVQHGTQSRSNPLIANAVRLLREGAIGEVLMAKAWNVQRRNTIGHRRPSAPPPGVDYDLWVGPAPLLPFQENRFHYNWRWWHNFGNGDIGNDGTHEIDYARWGLGVDTLPATAMGIGGKYGIDDDQEFPDTATLAFEYPGDGGVGHRRQLVFEMRLWSGNYPHNCDSGAEFYGTNGQLFVSKRGKVELLDGSNKRVEVTPPADAPPLPGHQADFVAAIRSGTRPAADIEEAYRTVALVHLGNLAVRLGRSLRLDPGGEQVVGDDEATRMLGRTYRDGHWAAPRA